MAIKRKNRFLIQTDVAKELKADMAIISRQVKAGDIEIEEKQIFINAGTEETPEFHKVKGRTIRVVDMDKIEKVSVVKFRRKTQ